MASLAVVERAGRRLDEAMTLLESSGASVGQIAELIHVRAYALMAECCGPTAAREWAVHMAQQAIESERERAEQDAIDTPAPDTTGVGAEENL